MSGVDVNEIEGVVGDDGGRMLAAHLEHDRLVRVMGCVELGQLEHCQLLGGVTVVLKLNKLLID